MKRVLFLGIIMAVVLVGTGHAQVCIESSGGLTFTLFLNPSTGNLVGTYLGTVSSGAAYGTLNSATAAFTVAWLAPDPGHSGIYQGVWRGNGTPVEFENDDGKSGIRTLAFCGFLNARRDAAGDDR